VALGKVFSENFGFPCQSTFHLLLHNHLPYHPRLAQLARSGLTNQIINKKKCTCKFQSACSLDCTSRQTTHSHCNRSPSVPVVTFPILTFNCTGLFWTMRSLRQSHNKSQVLESTWPHSLRNVPVSFRSSFSICNAYAMLYDAYSHPAEANNLSREVQARLINMYSIIEN
jgi:hypothetical protein